MIRNQNDIDKYSALNKIYIPNGYINQNYSYRFNGDYITIITNNNCYTNYNQTYCDCNYYNYKNNVMSNTYSCNTNNNNPEIAFSSITDDINYSSYIIDNYYMDKSMILCMFILGILFTILITKRGAYR